MIQHQGAAAGQADLPRVDTIYLIFGLRFGEKGLGSNVVLQHMRMLGHGALEKFLSRAEGLQIINEHFFHVRGKGVPQGACDDIVLLPHKAWALALLVAIEYFLVGVEKIFQILLEILFGDTQRGGAHDDAHVLGNLQFVYELLEILTFFTAFDLSTDAVHGVARRQHQIAAGKAHLRGHHGALGADLFAHCLHQDLLVAVQQILDASPTAILAHHVTGQFPERQEAVFLAAVMNEGRLQALIRPHHFGLVDVALDLLVVDELHIEVEEGAIQ